MIQPTRCNSFTSLLLDVYVWLNMFRDASPPIARSIQLHEEPLVLPLERCCSWSGRCQTTTNNAPVASLQRLNQRLLVRLYAPDYERGDARNMLSHT